MKNQDWHYREGRNEGNKRGPSKMENRSQTSTLLLTSTPKREHRRDMKPEYIHHSLGIKSKYHQHFFRNLHKIGSSKNQRNRGAKWDKIPSGAGFRETAAEERVARGTERKVSECETGELRGYEWCDPWETPFRSLRQLTSPAVQSSGQQARPWAMGSEALPFQSFGRVRGPHSGELPTTTAGRRQ